MRKYIIDLHPRRWPVILFPLLRSITSGGSTGNYHVYFGKKILMYRNEIQLYYFIENIVKGGNHGLIKNTSISNINKALINSTTFTSSASNIH